MDRSKDIEKCVRDIRLEHANLLRARRRAGYGKVEVTKGEQGAIVDKHADRYGLDAQWIRRIVGTHIRQYQQWHE